MRFVSYSSNGKAGLAILDGKTAYGISAADAAYPGDLYALIAEGGDALERAGAALRKGREIDLDSVKYFRKYCEIQAKAASLTVHFATEAIRATYNFHHSTNTNALGPDNVPKYTLYHIFRAVLRLLLYAKLNELYSKSPARMASAFFSQMKPWEFEEIRSIVEWLKYENQLRSTAVSSMSLDLRLAAHLSHERGREDIPSPWPLDSNLSALLISSQENLAWCAFDVHTRRFVKENGDSEEFETRISNAICVAISVY